MGFLHGDDLAARVGAARAVRRSGLVPVPIIAARRLPSAEALREYLAALRSEAAVESVLVVAGDPVQPLGPYPDASSVIAAGLLEAYGVREVSIAGHPGGHPAVAGGVLWQALAAKAAALEHRGLRSTVVTQFGIDPDVVLAWLVAAREHGVGLPVRVGVPGPAAARRLRAYAVRCGVSVSADAAEQYGLSLADPAGAVGPERFLRALAARYDAGLHGEVGLHINAFGGFAATALWMSRFRGR